MEIKNKILIRTRNIVLILFILLSTASFGNSSSEDFSQIFKEVGKYGTDLIARVVNSLFYGMMIMCRGVSLKISQLCGGAILFFIVINMLKIILRNIEKMDIYSIFKMMLPNLIKNLIIGFILVIPISYSTKWTIGGMAIGKRMVKGTFLTQFMEIVYSMFYRLGGLFFGDSSLIDITPGELAVLFMSRPLTLLQDVFGYMSFFSLFMNMARIIVLLFGLWVYSKIIAIYISNIFMSLMLTTFGTFYIIFLTMESTAHIGWKGINIIVVQAVTLFMTVAMMGISYQVMNLIVISSSVQGIAAMSVIIFSLQQVMENISMMAISITSGGGLGTNNGATFLGLSQAFGMMIGGLATFGGAKMDEFMSREGLVNSSGKGKSSDKEKRDYILKKARENVGTPLMDENSREPNVKDGYERRDKKNSLGTGSRASMTASIFIKGMTGNLSDIKALEGYRKELGNVFGNSENNPYNVMSIEQREKEARRLISIGWKDLWDRMGEINLSSEAGSMNEGVRTNIQNTSGNGLIEKDIKRFGKPFELKEVLFPYNISNINIEEHLKYIEVLNRNNINRIRNSEDEKRMIKDSINEYMKSKLNSDTK